MPTIDTPVRSNSAVSSGQHQNLSSARQTIERSTSRALGCLALAFFTVGASSLCVVGAFDYIATDWHLSRTATALLVTAFSGTLGLCAPLLQMLVGHWPRRSHILTGISVMATGSMVMAVAPNYPVLFAARSPVFPPRPGPRPISAHVGSLRASGLLLSSPSRLSLSSCRIARPAFA